jgi:hypothetical protein
MIIRALQPNDEEQLKAIHEKFYKQDFDYPDFRKFICAFVVVNEDEKVVSGGGIRAIAESIIVTDKDFSPKDRKIALMEMLQSSIYFGNKTGFDQIHAFVTDDKWYEKLKQYGFNDCKGRVVYI